MPWLNAIVCGSVAVTRDGRRCGKGEAIAKDRAVRAPPPGPDVPALGYGLSFCVSGREDYPFATQADLAAAGRQAFPEMSTAPARRSTSYTTVRTSRRRSGCRCWCCGECVAGREAAMTSSRCGATMRTTCAALGIDSGHFIPEEQPDGVYAALKEFFSV